MTPRETGKGFVHTTGAAWFWRRTGDAFFRSSVEETACALLSRAQEQEHGLAWRRPIDRVSQPLCGLSHGAAGIGLALAEAWAVTGEARFFEGMKSAFRYENAVYDVHAGNWPDFRLDGGGDGPEQMRYGCSWCHGAPGVALSRMRAARLLGRSVDETEISNAVRATQATVDATTFSLCHGFFGNLEVMIEASRAAPAPSSGLEVWMRRLLNELQYRTSDDIGWPCYEGEVGDSPGFMNGVAGIGYSLLRIAGDAGLSSMLVLGAE